MLLLYLKLNNLRLNIFDKLYHESRVMIVYVRHCNYKKDGKYYFVNSK